MVGTVAPWLEHLQCKCEDPSSVPSTLGDAGWYSVLRWPQGIPGTSWLARLDSWRSLGSTEGPCLCEQSGETYEEDF